VSLRGLFLGTTYFAVSSALALKLGLGVFVLMNGVFLMWLSFRGYLAWMQTRRARPRVYGFAWVLFAVSFGLPAVTMEGCGTAPPTTHAGWEAAWMTVQLSVNAAERTATLWHDPTQRTANHFKEVALSWLFAGIWNLPNLIMLASPYLLYLQQRDKGRLLSLVFGCAALSSWTWGAGDGPDLEIGYYVWSAGITTIALARRPGWPSLATLAALGGLWIILALEPEFL
jgi:hypothetical protein